MTTPPVHKSMHCVEVNTCLITLAKSKWDLARDVPVPSLDDKDRALVRRFQVCVERWIDSMVAGSWVGPHQRPYSRMKVSMVVLAATDAVELAHILPAYQEVAEHLTALATDSRCWVREVV